MMMKISYVSSILIFCCVIPLQHCTYRVKRIIGGTPENSTDQHFLAVLIGEKGYYWDVLKIWGENKKVYCSGSLISDQWLVTAAHCFTPVEKQEKENYQKNKEIKHLKANDIENKKQKRKYMSETNFLYKITDLSVPRYWKIRLAVNNLKPSFKERFLYYMNKLLDNPTRDIYYKITKIVRHPKYNPMYLENDVALIKLETKLNFSSNDYPKVVQLPNGNNTPWPLPGQICKVIGWGCEKYEGPVVNRPKYVHLPVLSSEKCRQIYTTYINLTENQEFCAGYYDHNKGICAGDSGGPLLCLDNGKSVLAGITSATHSDYPSRYPGLFARISYFKEWINDVMKNN